MGKDKKDQKPEDERKRDETLARLLKTPPKPHKPRKDNPKKEPSDK